MKELFNKSFKLLNNKLSSSQSLVRLTKGLETLESKKYDIISICCVLAVITLLLYLYGYVRGEASLISGMEQELRIKTRLLNLKSESISNTEALREQLNTSQVEAERLDFKIVSPENVPTALVQIRKLMEECGITVLENRMLEKKELEMGNVFSQRVSIGGISTPENILKYMDKIISHDILFTIKRIRLDFEQPVNKNEVYAYFEIIFYTQ